MCEERGSRCVPRTPRMSTFEFHVIFVCCEIPSSFDFCPRLFKNVKSILSALVLQKQVADWIWPVGRSGPPSGVDLGTGGMDLFRFRFYPHRPPSPQLAVFIYTALSSGILVKQQPLASTELGGFRPFKRDWGPHPLGVNGSPKVGNPISKSMRA